MVPPTYISCKKKKLKEQGNFAYNWKENEVKTFYKDLLSYTMLWFLNILSFFLDYEIFSKTKQKVYDEMIQNFYKKINCSKIKLGVSLSHA